MLRDVVWKRLGWGWGVAGVWYLVFCGGNGGGEVLCDVGRGMLDEIFEGLEVCLFSHCSRRIWGLGDKSMSSQDCHSWCEVMLWIG